MPFHIWMRFKYTTANVFDLSIFNAIFQDWKAHCLKARCGQIMEMPDYSMLVVCWRSRKIYVAFQEYYYKDLLANMNASGIDSTAHGTKFARDDLLMQLGLETEVRLAYFTIYISSETIQEVLEQRDVTKVMEIVFTGYYGDY